jgi:hypothetical protein
MASAAASCGSGGGKGDAGGGSGGTGGADASADGVDAAVDGVDDGGADARLAFGAACDLHADDAGAQPNSFTINTNALDCPSRASAC